MDKTEYMNTLKLALQDFPGPVQEEILWDYEGQFVDGMMAGEIEQEIISRLPKPQLIVAQKRARLHYQALRQRFSISRLGHLVVALFGLATFNLLMAIPALVYCSALCATYIAALVLYLSGVLITGVALSGAEHVTIEFPQGLSLPAKHHSMSVLQREIEVNIDAAGVVAGGKAVPEASAAAPHQPPTDSISIFLGRQFGAAEALKGSGMIAAGILLLMSCMWLTRYTWRGFRTYLEWNLNLLRAGSVA
ncbi:DUF1700 domain-containing protein [Undibacterium griseum]|uniref:DUF1700 domain-containing protein n=1 Tax=Undibacterium griseum TaxID=2762295 RepID=A0ABR6YPN2_9BURK|nr:DUF1700 domain-containing protein [Undibacterium griseum]MBC3885858.1 DUF1700 domain-containing protein [Undibacterium griseum]